VIVSLEGGAPGRGALAPRRVETQIGRDDVRTPPPVLQLPTDPRPRRSDS
jgi:hypothetical protein